ncbi:MAG: TIGR02281 family clan AA aspartic protease [Gammaproteobacteria bacterium]|uniref:retropepsin-like aspartic protease family protein n=1 Tax=Azohydromonas sp. TaxID=1872666 RepID=UPI002C7E1751|nr:retropepsin-like aspartic protease [Azohydromonas sp.]HMM85221.1 retropepsin-like aspartic protease [Azohydromonas sp.]
MTTPPARPTAAAARRVSTACAWLATGLAGIAAHAQTVTFNGSIGERAALLVIDGQPRTVAVGSAAGGVRLLGVRDGEAEVEIDARRQRLRLGAPVALGTGAARDGASASVVLSAGPGGHFTTLGSINGRPVQFMVDTGATTVAMGRAEAERIGLAWREGRAVGTRTANGVVAAHELTLRTVRVGEVEVAQVRAIVLPHEMPYVLLGNSFLSRFQMTRENDVMRLERRP